MVANRRSGHRTLGVILCCGVIATFASGASAQPAGSRVNQIVADLGSSDIVKREEAMRVLSNDASLTLSQLESLLKDPNLTPEQRCRVSQAAKQRFMDTPKPAMGVRFDNRLPDRVAIEQVYPGFPSANLLEAGDIIISCMGEDLHSRMAWVQLGAHIFSREPGDVVTLVVRRGKEKLTLSVPLGSYINLPNGNNNNQNPMNSPRIDDGRLDRAWELRCKSHLPEARKPIDPKLSDTEWRPEPMQAQTQKLSRYKVQMASYRPPKVVAGGEPRGGETSYDDLLMLAQQDPRNANAIVNRAWAQQALAQQGGMPQNASTFGGLVQTTAQELNVLENRKLVLERQLDALKAPGTLRPDQMVQLEQQFQMQREELARIRKQIQAIKAEVAEEKPAGAAAEPAPSNTQR
jgi:hypothetical protein